MKSLREFIEEYDRQTKEFFYDNLSFGWYAHTTEEEREDYINDIIEHNFNYEYSLQSDYNDKMHFFENFNKLTKLERANKFVALINESLKSFSIENFVNGLFKKFKELDNDYIGYEIVDNSISSKEHGAFKLIFDCEDDEAYNCFKSFIKKKEEIIKVCIFYRYYVSKVVDRYEDIGITDILFEPLDTENVTNKIKRNFNGKVYHITDKKYVDSIKKNGLLIASISAKSDYNDPVYYMTQEDIDNRTKHIDATTTRGFLRAIKNYRNFTDRTFVFYTDEDNIKTVGKYVCDMISHDPKKSVIIEINLEGHKNPFFRDTLMNDITHVHYAYSNIDIPAKMISNIIELD